MQRNAVEEEKEAVRKFASKWRELRRAERVMRICESRDVPCPDIAALVARLGREVDVLGDELLALAFPGMPVGRAVMPPGDSERGAVFA